MNDTYRQITEKEAELERLVGLLVQHTCDVNNLVKSCGKSAYDTQKYLIMLRIRRVNREIAELEDSDFVNVQIARRNARYPLIEPIRPIRIELVEA